MTFEVDIRGRTRTVSIERAAAGKYRVVLDSVSHEVDVARVGVYGLSLLVDGERGVSREVQVTPASERGTLLITLAGRTIQATLNGRRTSRASSDGSAGAHGEQSVVAPMPGRVVRLLVTAGEDVELRQGVVVVEAMKMENELRSPKKGRVKSISVTPGASVEAGRILMVVE
jgi:biotin carboxyl carrier protein